MIIVRVQTAQGHRIPVTGHIARMAQGRRIPVTGHHVRMVQGHHILAIDRHARTADPAIKAHQGRAQMAQDRHTLATGRRAQTVTGPHLANDQVAHALAQVAEDHQWAVAEARH